MQNIVVLVDLDVESSWRRALPRAIDYAGHAGARLHGVVQKETLDSRDDYLQRALSNA